MDDLFNGFPSIKFLLVVLCAIGGGGLFLLYGLILEIQALRNGFKEWQAELPEELAEAHEAAERRTEKRRENEFLEANHERVAEMITKTPQKPFTFTIDRETAELVEKLKPGSMTEWHPAEDEQ